MKLKHTLSLATALAALPLAAAETRPNIIYINIDDLGWGELGYTGSRLYESPLNSIQASARKTKNVKKRRLENENAITRGSGKTHRVGKLTMIKSLLPR